MALFEFLGRKKTKEESMPPLGPPIPEPIRRPMPAMPNIPPPATAFPSRVPTEKVVDLRGQGLSDEEIVSELQIQGYSMPQIESSLSQSKMSSFVKGQAPISGQEQPQLSEKDFEKLAESIVEEKWKAVEEKLEREREWKEKNEVRLATIEKSHADLKEALESLNRAIVGKISEYDRSILSVGTEMKAMEKVFKQILPTLTDNVTELSRVTKELKKKKAVAK